MPGYAMPSGDPLITAPVDERQTLGLELAGQLLLLDDSETPLPFGGLSEASVVVLKAVGSAIKVRLTSTAGSEQVVPLDSFMVLMNASDPFTAITVQNQTLAPVTVKFFLGQRA